MNYSIFGDSDCPIVQASLKRGETIKVERGSDLVPVKWTH